MKPPKAKKQTELRVTRKTNIGVHSAHGEGSWAVSYADMLMVLLSFFVMFFSLEDNEKATVDQQMLEISMSMMTDEEKAAAKAASRKPAAEAAKSNIEQMKELAQALEAEGVRAKVEGGKLIVMLDNSAFKSGSYRIQPKLRLEIDKVMSKLSPFKEKIQVTVVGHADQKKLRATDSLIQDNFDLSSFRALGVLKHVVKSGFPEQNGSARASSHFDRDARSVSIVVQALPPTAAGPGDKVPSKESAAPAHGASHSSFGSTRGGV